MRRSLSSARSSACAFALLVSACSGADSGDASPSAAATSAPSAAASPAPAAETQAREAGFYRLGDTRVALRGVLTLPGEPGTVNVLLTPTVLDAGERAEVLASTAWHGMPLMSKRTEAYPDRYPFVTVKLDIDGALAPASVRSYYIMAYGIREPNHTDNLNGFPGASSRIETLEIADGRLRLRFSGQEEIGGETRDWSFDIDTEAHGAR